jgi:hypothetical protein
LNRTEAAWEAWQAAKRSADAVGALAENARLAGREAQRAMSEALYVLIASVKCPRCNAEPDEVCAFSERYTFDRRYQHPERGEAALVAAGKEVEI